MLRQLLRNIPLCKGIVGLGYVLSGKNEAYYDWVALNYKMESFKNSLRLTNTFRILDLGGSSL